MNDNQKVITKTSLEGELVPAGSRPVREELVEQANAITEALLAIEPRDLTAREEQAKAIAQLGRTIELEMSRRSALLKTPMKTLVDDAHDGGDVAKDLMALQERVNEINPAKADFSMSAIRRLLSYIPGVGTPLSRWFARYQSVDSVIQDIVNSLRAGKIVLERDNVTLMEDQKALRQLGFQLEDYIALAQALDTSLSKAVAQQTGEKKQFLEEEILFPLRQRIIDLQQRLAVSQQGVLATEVIVRNNRELIKGVDRATEVTTMALNTAATLQVALAHQKKTLSAVQSVTDTTNDLIVQTSEQLKTQGVEIQKQASSAQLDVDKLRLAFENTAQALNDISTFRREALPQMAQSINEMDRLSGEMENAISKFEEGNAVAAEYEIKLKETVQSPR